jgi:hypothetical protein
MHRAYFLLFYLPLSHFSIKFERDNPPGFQDLRKRSGGMNP